MINSTLLLKDRSVLLAEDDILTKTYMEEILTMLFGSVFSASDGEKAYELYKNKGPDIILTDIKMPNCDGIGLIKRIRENDYETPIILLTSFVEQDLVYSATNLSIDGYLVKPIDLEKLTSTLCRAMERNDKKIGMIPLGKDFSYNFASKELYRGHTVVDLGTKERFLLLLLINNAHRTVTIEEIGKALWPYDPIYDFAIKSIIVRLRKKLTTDSILSVRGIGYRLNLH